MKGNSGGAGLPARRVALRRSGTVNGVRLHYEEHGSGGPILCIHGAGSSAIAWADAAKELARLGRVITYDRRGCARSERPVPHQRTSVAEIRRPGADHVQADSNRRLLGGMRAHRMRLPLFYRSH